VGVAAGAFGGVAAASSDALPGDSLYGLKRGMEDIRLGMTDGDSDRGRLYLDQASTRLSEARRLMERDRRGPLDHESVSEVRRALSGVRHDASEGRRLLLSAYRHDGSLGPIQALSTFSQSHRTTWTSLRDRLPVQLGDVSRQVSSVFDAIDHEVDPLRSLLPQPPTQNRDRLPGSGVGTTGSSDTGRPAPTRPGAGTSSGQQDGSDRPQPSTSGGSTEGLLDDDTGGLLSPSQDEGTPSPSGRTSPSNPDVTLPPLLPGLLPGLGINNQPGT
jgi:hypothetical protein